MDIVPFFNLIGFMLEEGNRVTGFRAAVAVSSNFLFLWGAWYLIAEFAF